MLAKCIHLHRRPWYGTRHTAGLVRGRTADIAFCPAQHWWAHRCWGWVPGQRISSKAFWMLGKCGPPVARKTNWLFLLCKCLKRFQDFWWSKLPRGLRELWIRLLTPQLSCTGLGLVFGLFCPQDPCLVVLCGDHEIRREPFQGATRRHSILGS